MKRKILFLVFATLALFSATSFANKTIVCPGMYANHLQGITMYDGKIYWSYTTKIICTDIQGKFINTTDAPSHQGDLCAVDGKIYVATNNKKFNKLNHAENYVYVYDTNLKFIEKIKIDEMVCGLGGMEYHNGSFYLVGGADPKEPTFRIGKYSKDFKLEKMYYIPVGKSQKGVQTICFGYGKFWLGVYQVKGANEGLWEMDTDFNIVKKHNLGGSVGIVATNKNEREFIIARAMYLKQDTFAKCTANAKIVKVEK
jgi:outer membrane protein assembly factor BamB